MRLLVLACVVALTAASCSPDEVSDSTTSTVAPVTSTSSTTSTTSTTSSSSTTSTIPTTTTTLLEGNWADQPVITSGIWWMTLGWWDGAQWVQAEEGTILPVEGAEDYQVAVLGSSLIVQGGSQIQSCDLVGPFPGVELSDPDPLSFSLDSEASRSVNGVAISAGWDIQPRPATQGEAHPDFEALGVDLLDQMGYDTETAPQVQTVDADLDGDGAIETIVVVEDTELANSGSDVYSLVFVVTVGRVEPIVVESSVIPAGEEGYPASFRIGAIADLNGDSTMEIVLSGLAWEAEWVSVYELTEGRFVQRLGAGCGV